MTEAEVLNQALQCGIIDINTIQEQIEMNERKKYLNMHGFSIWQSDTDKKWRTYLPDEKNGRKLIKRNTEDEIKDLVISYYKSHETVQKTKAITLKDIFAEWLKFKSVHTESTSYIKRITADWKKYYLPQKDFINKPLRSMNKIYLDEWAHGMIKSRELTKKQYYNMSVILRQCMEYAVECGYLETNEFEKVHINTKLFKRTKKKTGETQVYSEEEESKLIEDMIRRFHRNPSNTAPLAVMFMFETGLRIGEACALKFSDIEGDYISICRQEVREFEFVDDCTMKFKCFKIAEYTKTEYGYREVYLTETARKIIDICRKVGNGKSDFIFTQGDKNVNHYSIQAMIKRGCEHLDMMVKTAHKIRKTYISTLIDSGLNIDEIRKTVGHSDERTTYGNYCFNRKSQKETENIIEFALNSKKVIKEVIKSNQNLDMPDAEKPRFYAVF